LVPPAAIEPTPSAHGRASAARKVLPVINDIFVFDNVCHVYDFSENNALDLPEMEAYWANFRKKTSRTKWSSGDVGKFTGDFNWMRKFDLADMYQLMFEVSPVDMAMSHAVPVFDWFKDGTAPVKSNYEFAKRYPERVLFCGAVDPIHHGLHGAMDEMTRQVEELGAVSFKFYNAHVDLSWSCDDRDLAYPLYEHAQRLGIKILQFHKGAALGQWRVEDLRPNDLQKPARDFPDITFVVHHLGMPFFDETVNIASRFPNVHLALSANLALARVAPRKVQKQLGELLMHVGPDKLMWGSEAAMTGAPGPFLKMFMELEIPEDLQENYGYPPLTLEDKRKILGANMAKMMGISIPEKIKELNLAPTGAAS
jgi:predicted TIM-barrel fold metal-dependent hydrolase